MSSQGHDVFVQVPAEEAYVSVLRTTTAGLAARLDFTLDDIEDLRMAIGEACAMVLPFAGLGDHLECSVRLGDHRLEATVAADTHNPRPLPTDGLGWQVLTALTTGVRAEVTGTQVRVVLDMKSGLAD